MSNEMVCIPKEVATRAALYVRAMAQRLRCSGIQTTEEDQWEPDEEEALSVADALSASTPSQEVPADEAGERAPSPIKEKSDAASERDFRNVVGVILEEMETHLEVEPETAQQALGHAMIRRWIRIISAASTPQEKGAE